MKLAFLIAAHTQPLLLARLIRRLQGPLASIFVHIDAQVPNAPFVSALHDAGIDGVHMAPRVRSAWASFGQVKASLSLLDTAIQHDRDADRFLLISGQDYPLMQPSAMADFFARHSSCDFLTYHPLPWSAWEGNGGLDRLRRYHFAMGTFGFTYPSEKVPSSRRVRAAYAACKILLPRERALPRSVTLYGGSNWWNLSRASALSLLEYLRANVALVRRFRYTRAADEIFFQTTLLNSGPSLPPANDDLRFTVWDESRNELPATLGPDDFLSIAASGKLFARKMGLERSAALLDRIDAELLR